MYKQFFTTITVFLLLIITFCRVNAQINNNLIITQVQISGDKATEEFIEIYNQGDYDLNLLNYKLAKKTKSGNQSNLVTKFPDITIPAKSHLLITHTDYNGLTDLLYSTSASIAKDNTIILYNNNGDEIDRLGMGNATIYYEQTAPNPQANQSLNRKQNNNIYQNTKNNFTDWFINENPQPQTLNSNPISDNPNNETIENPNFSKPKHILNPEKGMIIINEIMPNPQKGDNEWVELYNTTGTHIDLNNWLLIDASKKETTLSGIIGANNFILIEKINGNLNNSGDTIQLVSQDTIIDSLTYNSTNNYAPLPQKGEALARINESQNTQNNQIDFAITTLPTPGQLNQIIQPIITKPETDAITIDNNIKTIPDTNKKKSFNQDITNSGSIGINQNTISPIVEKPLLLCPLCPPCEIIQTPTISSEENTITETKQPKTENTSYSAIYISEFLPNPSGADTNEWIELYNPNNHDINLENWILDDSEGGSKPYTFSSQTIPSEGYLLVKKNQTNITLNNTSDSVRLFSPDNEIQDQIDYDDCQENKSYARNQDQEWLITTELTPGYENIFPTVSDKDNNNQIKTNYTGIVTVQPGILGKNYFFMQNSGQGWQIYMHKPNFPNLQIGDFIEVTGELSESFAGHKINISSKDNILILEKDHLPEINIINSQMLNESLLGKLITIKGKVIEKNNRHVYLVDEFGEVEIYFKFNPPQIKTEEVLEITGIVSLISDEYKILPRSNNDIINTTQNLTPTKQTADKSTTSPVQENDIQTPLIIQTNNTLYLWQIGTGILGISSIFLIIYLVKLKKEFTI